MVGKNRHAGPKILSGIQAVEHYLNILLTLVSGIVGPDSRITSDKWRPRCCRDGKGFPLARAGKGTRAQRQPRQTNTENPTAAPPRIKGDRAGWTINGAVPSSG